MKKYFILVVLISTLIIINNFNNKSYSLEDEISLNLTMKYHPESLESDLMKYIDLIDESIFASLNDIRYDFALNEDYHFMTNFAINFIINHRKYYEPYIETLEPYFYEIYNVKYETDEYISLDIIYDITSHIFNVKDYYIINDDVKVKDGVISLLDYDNSVDMVIKEIEITRNNNDLLNVYVTYKDIDIKYCYTFKIDGDKLYFVDMDIGGYDET